jgi:hypothetical protein
VRLLDHAVRYQEHDLREGQQDGNIDDVNEHEPTAAAKDVAHADVLDDTLGVLSESWQDTGNLSLYRGGIVVGELAKMRQLRGRWKPFEHVKHEAGGLQQGDLRGVASHKKTFSEQSSGGAISISLF